MLEKAFNDVYTKFKLHFYQNVFQRFATREATLTTVESFCMEGIMAMGEPTIAEFSRMMQISTPNAAYKIGSLVRKGYVEKIQSTTDRREYHLRPTQKYIDYYNISYSYLSTVVQRVNKRFPKEDVKKLEQMLTIISNELMPELNLENNPEAPEEKKDRTAPQRCGAALFFSAGTGCAANKKSPRGLAGPSGARQRRAGPLRTAPCLRPASGLPASRWCPPHSLFEPVPAASVSSCIPRLLCRSPVVFLHYITSVL